MSRLFSSLPSVNDLLETQPLKGVIDRVGRNQVVAETARFLDRMRLQAQSAAQQAFHFTTQDLAQRVARWIAAGAPSGQRSIINATGTLLPTEFLGPPLATEAIDAMAHTGGAYHVGDLAAAVSTLVARQTGCEAALVFPSASAAMLSALAALSSGREVLLRRGELERDPAETPLDDLARVAGVTLREVGSINETTLADYESARSANTGTILSIALRYSPLARMNTPSLAELAAMPSRQSMPLIADLGWSGVLDLSSYGLTGLTTARAAKEAGADLILLRGHGCLGGPACGIVAGQKSLIERIGSHPLARSTRATAPVLAAVAATLELYETATTAEQQIPLISLISTSVDNLKLRAERLAPQLAAVAGIAAAEPVETRSPVAARQVSGEELLGWAIALVPASGNAAELAGQLLGGTQAVAARLEPSRVLLELRSVAPKYDLALVDAVMALSKPVEGGDAASVPEAL
jgi:L-seryl-tRNA(Ser) seleniumtransferase